MANHLLRCACTALHASRHEAEHLLVYAQEKQQYMRELEELIPQMEGLIQDKESLQQQVGVITQTWVAETVLTCLSVCQ